MWKVWDGEVINLLILTNFIQNISNFDFTARYGHWMEFFLIKSNDSASIFIKNRYTVGKLKPSNKMFSLIEHLIVWFVASSRRSCCSTWILYYTKLFLIELIFQWLEMILWNYIPCSSRYLLINLNLKRIAPYLTF